MHELEFSSFINQMLAAVNIVANMQRSSNIEIDNALKTASKSQTGKFGYPDHIAIVNDYVLVMEDKADKTKLCLRDGYEISMTIDATKNYAVNGALFYAKKIIEGTRYTKIFAFGNVGDRKHHTIKPVFIDAQNNIKELPAVDTFTNFTAEHIDAYYDSMVCGQESQAAVELKQIISKAETLHEHLRNYGQLGETEKPLVVSAILLALAEKKHGFDISQLNHDDAESDGTKIFKMVERHLGRVKVSPEFKKNRVLDQFRLIKNRPLLNAVNETLHKTPLRYFAEYIEENIFDAVVNNSAEDYLGRFYGEFISYSGGDGQSLGVVLTPSHIAELFCDLVNITADDVVFDPCCGTGSFLITAMSRMLALAKNDEQRENIKKTHIHGIEVRDDMFSIATTNMILRGDGKSNLICDDFFSKNASDLQLLGNGVTVGFMNPPYSQAKSTATAHLSELRFILHLLNSVTTGGRVAVIVPVSAMIGKNKDDKVIKGEILKKHTLEGVISLNKNTFYRIGTVPCIAVFTADRPHPKNKLVKFINFENDGYEVQKHMGLVETERAKDRKQYLLGCWRGEIDDVPSKFMVQTTIEDSDEWLHSFYYYNDEIPTEADFINTIADYLTFEFNMIVHGRSYLFDGAKKNSNPLIDVPPLDAKQWKAFRLIEYFKFIKGDQKNMTLLDKGDIPIVSAKNINNGYKMFVSSQGQHIFKGDCLTINNNGDGGAGISYYQPADMLLDNHVTALIPYDAISRETMLFISRCITIQRERFGYGYTLSVTRLRVFNLMLPINDSGEPDFEYMENYIRVREHKLIQQYLSYLKATPPRCDSAIVPLSEKHWREFFIEDFAEIISGRDIYESERIKGSFPYIGASANNNGVCHFISNENDTLEENCISVNRNGSVGYAFYHPYAALYSNDCRKIRPYIKNEFSSIFIAHQIAMQREKYSYGYKMGTGRLKKQKILLPVNDKDEPDFEYMEQYTKQQFAQILKMYLKR